MLVAPAASGPSIRCRGHSFSRPIRHMNELKSPSAALNAVVDVRRLRILLQPIIDFDAHRIHGYEAHVRGPSDHALAQPLKLLSAADEAGCLAELEIEIARTVSSRYLEQELVGHLFFNVTAGSLCEEGFRSALEEVFADQVRTRRVILEIGDLANCPSTDVLETAVAQIRAAGFAVALDNLGGAGAVLAYWWLLRPDYVKLDRSFAAGLHLDPSRQHFVRSMLNLALGLSCRLVVTGVETIEDSSALEALGVRLAEGYFFGRPRQLGIKQLPKRVPRQDLLQRRRARTVAIEATVGNIVKDSRVIAPATPVEEVGELFRTSVELEMLPVVDEGRPVGVVERNSFMQVFASRFGRELYGRRPIAQFMNPDPLVAEVGDAVESVSRLLTAESADSRQPGFIVTSKGEYLGVASVMDLLRRITELRVTAARYANPLTLLPGNVPIAETINGLLLDRESFAVVYCDIDNFKPFNDVYGYGRGDDVISAVANLLQRAVDPEVDFVGHVGGDDFILVFRSEDWRQRCEDLLTEFDSASIGFYDPEHREAGGVQATDRRGKDVFYEFCSLSLGAVTVTTEREISSADEIAVLASEAKTQAKNRPGSMLFVDRRSGPG